MGTIALIVSLTYLAQGPVVVDRIAVIAGKHVIKASDIERDLRVTEFLNREPLSITADRKRKAADRLIDQAIIRDEISTGEYHRAADADAKGMLEQIRKDRFGGSEARFRQALAPYGLSEEQLQEYLLWQLTVLRFIDERFRPAVLVTDDDVRSYYDQHLTELKREYPSDSSFATLEPKIRTSLEGQKVNEEFESWLDGARKRQRIEYIQGALG
jgi:DNA-binding transcriptional ArsR family regulator